MDRSLWEQAVRGLLPLWVLAGGEWPSPQITWREQL